MLQSDWPWPVHREPRLERAEEYLVETGKELRSGVLPYLVRLQTGSFPAGSIGDDKLKRLVTAFLKAGVMSAAAPMWRRTTRLELRFKRNGIEP